MQANSRTVINVKDGLVTVHSTEQADLAAVHFLLCVAAKSILDMGKIDGHTEPAVQVATEGELTQAERVLNRLNGTTKLIET